MTGPRARRTPDGPAAETPRTALAIARPTAGRDRSSPGSGPRRIGHPRQSTEPGPSRPAVDSGPPPDTATGPASRSKRAPIGANPPPDKPKRPARTPQPKTARPVSAPPEEAPPRRRIIGLEEPAPTTGPRRTLRAVPVENDRRPGSPGHPAARRHARPSRPVPDEEDERAMDHNESAVRLPRTDRRSMSRLVPIVENVRIARDTYRMRLGDPEMAGAIRPGQFVMIRPGPEGTSDPLLGRPLALYDVVRDPAGAAVAFEIVYLVVGRGTAALTQRRSGERISVWGPLGNGFGPPPAGPVIFVAGGIGQTPFLALGRWWLGRE